MNFASHVLMVRPKSFGFNPQTGTTNSFQTNAALENANEKACTEFDSFVDLLCANDIKVTVIDDTETPAKPDAVFPNNWFSTHADGKIILYPMQTANRRAEVRMDIVNVLTNLKSSSKVIDLTPYATKNIFLEGTGSLVFDHATKKCFAVLSPRTNIELVRIVCAELGYKPVLFNAADRNGNAVYHTNVVMCVGDGFCVACVDSIEDKNSFISEVKEARLELIDISYKEMESFAGNMLMLGGSENILVMSDTAYRCLRIEVIQRLSDFAKIIHPAIPTIELLGGGSVRCMMAEIFHS